MRAFFFIQFLFFYKCSYYFSSAILWKKVKCDTLNDT
nr:MAG TPA: hypothetical protein [Caudoviricetes sp.]DAX16986.1 MAG TPA: hypothetical protein [Caudoviricetes sp.]